MLSFMCRDELDLLLKVESNIGNFILCALSFNVKKI